MRGARLVGLSMLALAGCSDGDEPPQPGASASPPSSDQAKDSIPCAVGAGKPQDCLRERGTGPDGPTWTIRRGDGGFRRFVLIDGGRRIAAADGADEVRTTRHRDFLEVFVANEYYRFPNAHAAR